MSTRHLIASADPARALAHEDRGLDVDALLRELHAQTVDGARAVGPRVAPPRRRRLDLALAAVIAACLAAVAFLPVAGTHRSTVGSTPSATADPAADARTAASALMDEVPVPADARPVSTPPAGYLTKAWTGSACKGTASVHRWWIVPGTTVPSLQRYLQRHRPAGVRPLSFVQSRNSEVSTALTSYRPGTGKQVVIALATTAAGVGVRADAFAVPGSTCLDPES